MCDCPRVILRNSIDSTKLLKDLQSLGNEIETAKGGKVSLKLTTGFESGDDDSGVVIDVIERIGITIASNAGYAPVGFIMNC